MPSNHIPVARPYLLPGSVDKMTACLESGWWGYGPACRSLESRFVDVTGGWALATSSCTSALYLAAKALWRPGAEVIVPAITYPSTALAFLEAGFRVCVADVDPATLMITADTVARCISSATVAVVIVHLYGQLCDSAALYALCKGRGAALIEDCAHRLDILDDRVNQRDFSCYSFNAVKEAPAGEGGLLWGRDPAHKTLAEAASNVGLTTTTWVRSAVAQHKPYAFEPLSGLKLLLNDLAATLALSALDQLAELRVARRAQYEMIAEACSNYSPLVTPMPYGFDHSALMLVLRIEPTRRQMVRDMLASHGIHTAIHYPSLGNHPLLHRSPAGCKVAAAASAEVLSLPNFVGMTNEQQVQLLDGLRCAFESGQ